MTSPLQADTARPATGGETMPGPATLRVPADPDELLDVSVEQGWGDGLPVVPPTEARVADMLRFTDREPDEVLGVLPPGRGAVTVRAVAVNAVLAGCRANHFPVVLTAVAAMVEHQNRLNVYGALATTNPVTTAGFVNGPVVGALDFNASWNCLGQGNRANATVGRAIRLASINLGGARPGEMDRATHGFPGKYSFFFAENEGHNPWEPVHVEAGFDADVSTVTLLAAAGTLNMLEFSENGEEILRTFADSIAFPTSNDYLCVGEPWLVLAPEHAAEIHAAGFTKAAVREYLWEHSKLPFHAFSTRTREYIMRPAWGPVLGELDDDTPIPIGETPESIKIVIAGGPSVHSVYLPTFGDSRAVTVPITDREGRPIRDFTKPVR